MPDGAYEMSAREHSVARIGAVLARGGASSHTQHSGCAAWPTMSPHARRCATPFLNYNAGTLFVGRCPATTGIRGLQIVWQRTPHVVCPGCRFAHPQSLGLALSRLEHYCFSSFSRFIQYCISCTLAGPGIPCLHARKAASAVMWQLRCNWAKGSRAAGQGVHATASGYDYLVVVQQVWIATTCLGRSGHPLC